MRAERERTVRMMICAYCGRNKAWPDAFPNTLYADCWECVWDRHQRDVHPPKRRWWRRAAAIPVQEGTTP